jgi:hypothetical protein
MKKKLRKFSDGGYSTVDPENPVPSINDDTRSKAMKFVENASEESRDIGAPVTRSAAKTSSKVSQTVAPAKPAMDMDKERARIKEIQGKQGLENVSPELDLLPIGKVAAGTAALYAGARAIGKRMLANRAEKEAARTITTKAGKEIPIKQSKPDFSGSAKEGMGMKEVVNKSGKKIPVKRENSGMVDDGGSGAFKRGGSVSSASRRADGCAIRGKTRA